MRNLYVYPGEVGVVFEISFVDENGDPQPLAGADAVYLDIEGLGSLECEAVDLDAGQVKYVVVGDEFVVPAIRAGQGRAVWTVPAPATVKSQAFEFEVRRAPLLP